jgi:hypothetical protein
MSVRLHFVVEGQTEETYVKRVLKPHLASVNVWVAVRAIETGRKRGTVYRGGLGEYAKLRSDLTQWMKQDDHPEVFFTSMIDFYGLGNLRDAFPGWKDSKQLPDPLIRVAKVEDAFAADIGHHRFIPYLQLHEFESLLLASPDLLLSEFIGHEEEVERLKIMVASFASPELINDGPDTAPSKRIIAVLPQYAGMKASAGPIVAEKIGIPLLRSKCLHFANWLTKLEKLGEKV